MRSITCCLLLTAAVNGASVRERAAIPPVRAPPKIGETPNSPYHPNAVHPPEAPGAGNGALTGAAAAGRGTAPESTTPFKSEEGLYARNKELIDKALESIEDVFDLLGDIVDLIGGDDDDDEADEDEPSTPRPPKPTQVSSTSDGATNSTANYILSQNNVTYTFFSDPRLISQDVVAEMSGPFPNRLSFQEDLFTAEEYSLFVNSPVCFYANIERMYSSASAEAASASTLSTTAAPSATQSPSSSDEDNTSCVDIGVGPTVCTAIPGSPQWTSSQASEISSLWAYQLPDQLWSAHFATPTAVSGEVTATATSTTSCPAFDGGEGGPVTSYRELKVRGGDNTETETSGGDGAVETSTEVANAAGKMSGGMRSGWWLVGIVAWGLTML